jgi:hypothetical protein
MIQGLQHDTRHRFVSKTGRFRGAESAEKQGKQEVLGLLHTLEVMGSKLRARSLSVVGKSLRACACCIAGKLHIWVLKS